MIKPTAVFVHAKKPPFTHIFFVEFGGRKERLPVTLKRSLDGTFSVSFPPAASSNPLLARVANRFASEDSWATHVGMGEWVLVDGDGNELCATCLGISRRARVATVFAPHGNAVAEVYCYPSAGGGWEPSTAVHCWNKAIDIDEALRALRFSRGSLYALPLFTGRRRREPGGFSIEIDRRTFWELPACIYGVRGKKWSRVKREWQLAPEFFY